MSRRGWPQRKGRLWSRAGSLPSLVPLQLNLRTLHHEKSEKCALSLPSYSPPREPLRAASSISSESWGLRDVMRRRKSSWLAGMLSYIQTHTKTHLNFGAPIARIFGGAPRKSVRKKAARKNIFRTFFGVA